MEGSRTLEVARSGRAWGSGSVWGSCLVAMCLKFMVNKCINNKYWIQQTVLPFSILNLRLEQTGKWQACFSYKLRINIKLWGISNLLLPGNRWSLQTGEYNLAENYCCSSGWANITWTQMVEKIRFRQKSPLLLLSYIAVIFVWVSRNPGTW